MITRKELIRKLESPAYVKRRERILFSFSYQEMNNPHTKNSVLKALKNIDRELNRRK